jgi:hypothetical protein
MIFQYSCSRFNLSTDTFDTAIYMQVVLIKLYCLFCLFFLLLYILLLSTELVCFVMTRKQPLRNTETPKSHVARVVEKVLSVRIRNEIVEMLR